MGRRVLKGRMDLKERRYELINTLSNICFCLRSKFLFYWDLLMSTTMRVIAGFVFQGEMGSEGLRGLAGESGNKGTKVRRDVLWVISFVLLFEHYTLLIYLIPSCCTFSQLSLLWTGRQWPARSQGTSRGIRRAWEKCRLNVTFWHHMKSVSEIPCVAYIRIAYTKGNQRWPRWCWTKRRIWTAWTKGTYHRMCMTVDWTVFRYLEAVHCFNCFF